MRLLVPFDGSALAEAALDRAAQFSETFDAELLAVTVIPNGNAAYARDRGWLDADEPFDRERIVSRLRERVQAAAPSASFEHIVVDRSAPYGTIAVRIRTLARELNAAMVFVGSENAGRIVTSVSSVGANVATEDSYDVVIVRSVQPAPSRGRSDSADERQRR